MNKVKQAEAKARLNFAMNPDYRQNPYPKDSMDYKLYEEEIEKSEEEDLEFIKEWGFA